jgi:hypothetical protein
MKATKCGHLNLKFSIMSIKLCEGVLNIRHQSVNWHANVMVQRTYMLQKWFKMQE